MRALEELKIKDRVYRVFPSSNSYLVNSFRCQFIFKFHSQVLRCYILYFHPLFPTYNEGSQVLCHRCYFSHQVFSHIVCRWCFDVELVYLCKRVNIPIKEVSVNWTEIPVKIFSIAHMLIELIWIRLGYGLQIWKVQRQT